MSDMATWAREVARELLEAPLPRRWEHSKGVAERARSLAPILAEDADLLEAAAWLHDIGYSPAVDVTGFHPLDGARHLRDVRQADEKLYRLVANHSCAILEAHQRGLADVLAAEFPPLSQTLHDALTYCDMTTTPDGSPVTVGNRLSEIRERYGPGHLVTRFIGDAEPHLVGAVRNVQDRMFLAEWGL
jgi:putative nucleotidyltransferase with HDIG domain